MGWDAYMGYEYKEQKLAACINGGRAWFFSYFLIHFLSLTVINRTQCVYLYLVHAWLDLPLLFSVLRFPQLKCESCILINVLKNIPRNRQNWTANCVQHIQAFRKSFFFGKNNLGDHF